MSSRREGSLSPARAALLAAAAAAVAFLPSLWAGFVYDDVLLVAENPYAHELAHAGRAFRTHLWDIYQYGSAGIGLRYYRPLVTLSYILNWLVGGGSAASFHLFNLLCHAGVTALAVTIAARWTRSVGLGLAIGLLFALHPTRTESVIWIAGRTDLMMALFSLGAVELAHRAAGARGAHRVVLGAGVVASAAAATLSKEAGALTALLVAIEAAAAAPGSRERRRILWMALALAMLGVAYVAGRAAFYPVRPEAVVFDPTPAYGLMTVWAYVERLFVPWPQTFFYRPVEARAGLPAIPPLLVGLGALVTAGYLALTVHAVRRDRTSFLLLFSAACLLGPLLNFSYTGIFVTTSDHFLYLPLLLFAIGVARLFGERLRPALGSRAARLALGGVLLLSVAVDGVRALDYRSDETLFGHELELEPDNPFALSSIAVMRARQGELSEAYELLARAQAPPATRFFLLAAPETRAGIYVRQLALRAALLADGEVSGLRAIFAELDALSRGEPRTVQARVLDLEIGMPIRRDVLARLLASEGGFSIAAEAAVVGGRLGSDVRVRELLAAVPDDRIWRVSSPLNVALTHARVSDFSGARRRLAALRAPPSGVPPVPLDQSAELTSRLLRAERLLDPTPGGGERGALGRALAMAELGAYLRALRELRPVYELDPAAPGVAPLYVQLLVAARLDGEARRAAERALGAGRAAQTLGEIFAQLSPRVRALPPATEPSPWWPP